MKDFLSKLTFGFLMAQFVPGVIAISSIIFLYAAFTLEASGKSLCHDKKQSFRCHKEECIFKKTGCSEVSLDSPNSIKTIITETIIPWFEPVGMKVLFVLLSVGSGMLIHGIHWAVLAYLQTVLRKDSSPLRKIHELPYHNMLIILQVIFGPVIILIETFAFLFTGLSIKNVMTHENVPKIKKDEMDAFNFLQDFYLHFAQFYAHTGYALLVLFISLCVFVLSFGHFKTHWILLAATYILSGLFFVIGRIQLETLFNAEREIVEK